LSILLFYAPKQLSVGINPKEIKLKLLNIKKNIKNTKEIANNRISTQERVASEYIRLSAELFTKGMLYNEFTDVIEAIDIREHYGNAVGTSCHYSNYNRKNLYMITKKTVNYSEYMYGIEVDKVSKKITRIGYFKPRYDITRSKCRVSYVGVPLKDIIPGNQEAAF